MSRTLLCGICLLNVYSVLAFPNGAPKELCGSPLGRPVHNNTLPQNTCSPFRLYLNSTVYSPNTPVNMTIYGNGETFRGFLVTADTTTGMFDGTCLNTNQLAKAVPNCGMTHSDNSDKTSLTLLWYPPLLVHVGNVQFKLVIVQNYTTFWSDVRSAMLQPNHAEYYSIKEVMNIRMSQSAQSSGQGQSMPAQGQSIRPSQLGSATTLNRNVAAAPPRRRSRLAGAPAMRQAA